MAYRETEKTRAKKDAQRALIIASAIDVIIAHGLEGMDTRAIAARAGIAKGLIFRYFADKAELVAQIEVTIMNRDMNAVQLAAEAEAVPLRALAAALGAQFRCFAQRPSREMMTHSEAYRATLTRALGHIIGASDVCPRNEARMVARAALGALFGMAALEGGVERRFATALRFALRGVGLSAADQRKVEMA